MRIKSIKKVTGAPVYNLFVEDTHNFITAGGLVSHNCDGMRYLAVSVGVYESVMSDVYA